MADEKRPQTPPTDQAKRDINERGGVVRDKEFAASEGGARPAPDPKPATPGPFNRVADLAGDIQSDNKSDASVETREFRPEFAPTPQPRKTENEKD